GGASTEKVHSTALAHHVDGLLPGFGTANRFDNHIGAAFVRGKHSHRVDRIFHLGDLNHFVRSHALRGFYLRVTLHDRDHIAPCRLRDLYEHETNRSAADHSDSVADFYTGFVQPAKHTGQRFNHGGFFVADVGRHGEHVGLNNAPRNADVLSVSAVVKQQVLAQVFLMLGAVEAH